MKKILTICLTCFLWYCFHVTKQTQPVCRTLYVSQKISYVEVHQIFANIFHQTNNVRSFFLRVWSCDQNVAKFSRSSVKNFYVSYVTATTDFYYYGNLFEESSFEKNHKNSPCLCILICPIYILDFSSFLVKKWLSFVKCFLSFFLI